MFIKKIKKNYPNTGKSYFVYQLFESIETPFGFKDNFLLSLGVRLNLPQSHFQILADCIKKFSENSSSFEGVSEDILSLARNYAEQLLKRNKSLAKSHRSRSKSVFIKTPRVKLDLTKARFDEKAPKKASSRLVSINKYKPTNDKLESNKRPSSRLVSINKYKPTNDKPESNKRPLRRNSFGFNRSK